MEGTLEMCSIFGLDLHETTSAFTHIIACIMLFCFNIPGKTFGEKNVRCALIDGDSRDPSNSHQFLANRAIWR